MFWIGFDARLIGPIQLNADFKFLYMCPDIGWIFQKGKDNIVFSISSVFE